MTNAASKEDSKFTGKPDKGLTFEEFDKKALSWARNKYGNTFVMVVVKFLLSYSKNLGCSMTSGTR
jgi:hypothetical protein